MPSWRAALPWPLAVIDFEASSLDQDSYPIEVGLALWPAPDGPVLGWSTLVQPAVEWTRRGHWSPASPKVHRVRGSDLLLHGQPPARVAAALNTLLGPVRVAWCDGGPYDAHWAGALFRAGGAAPAFALGDWHRLVAMAGPAARERTLDWLARAPRAHRAQADAEQLLLALLHGVAAEAGPVQGLAGQVPALAALAAPGV